MPSVVNTMEMLIPSINHTHRALLDGGYAKDLTGKEIVDNATAPQLEWMRKQGFIA